jgi:hypothetical protein
MALGLKTGLRAEKCYFTPANSVLKFNFTPARAKNHFINNRLQKLRRLNLKWMPAVNNINKTN